LFFLCHYNLPPYILSTVGRCFWRFRVFVHLELSFWALLLVLYTWF